MPTTIPKLESRAFFSKALSLAPPPSPILASSGVTLTPLPSQIFCAIVSSAPSFPYVVSTSFLVPLPPSHLARTCWAPNSTKPSSNVQSKSRVLPQHNIPCSNYGDLFTHQGLNHHQRWCQAFQNISSNGGEITLATFQAPSLPPFGLGMGFKFWPLMCFLAWVLLAIIIFVHPIALRWEVHLTFRYHLDHLTLDLFDIAQWQKKFPTMVPSSPCSRGND